MDTSLRYRKMCIEATELQDNWNPQIGDYMISKACYCHEEPCSRIKPCNSCLESSNTYVISGRYDFHASVGGTKWYYGGHSCVRGYGNRMNSTSCYVMTGERMDYNENDFNTSSIQENLWLPRQDQIQGKFLQGLFSTEKIAAFYDWLTDAVFYPDATMEQLWLMYYMNEKYKKSWSHVNKKWVGDREI